MRTLNTIISSLILAATLAGCGFYKEKSPPTGLSDSNGDDNTQEGAKLSFRAVREQVLVTNCISCHGNSGGVNLETYESVRANLSRIERVALIDKTMPKGRTLGRNEARMLRAWIRAGAPEGDGHDQPPEPVQPKYSSIRKKIFEVRCVSCHSDGGQAHGVPLIPYKELLKSPRDLVLPGNVDESGLMIVVTRQDAKRMPPPTAGSALSDEEVAAIKKWIQDGAKDDDTAR